MKPLSQFTIALARVANLLGVNVQAGPFGSVSHADVERKYGPTGAHLTGSEVELDDILILGSVTDPETTGGRLVTWDLPASSSEAFEWLLIAKVRAAHVYIASPGNLDLTQLGPRKGEPAGVYRVERIEPVPPTCRRWYDPSFQAEIFDENRQHAILNGPPGTGCFTYQYEGPLESFKYNTVAYYYRDQEFGKKNY
jgi:hypothetical protein